ncbi:MAG: glycogen/starch synthase [Gemmatimonadetes bacterium]|nr:glycogen/starch synthase [Gemmatimonadota bacterium]
MTARKQSASARPPRSKAGGRSAVASPRPPKAAAAKRPEVSPLQHDGRAVTIVHVSAECAPWAQEGALGQAVHELAEAQAAGGRPVLVIAPAYHGVREEHPELVPVGEPFEVPLGDRHEVVALLGELAPSPGAPWALFVDHRPSFDRVGIYGDASGSYDDNPQRFALFAKAAVQAALRLVEGPVVVHAHDWHAALTLVYLRTDETLAGAARAGALLTVHDATYQGHAAPELMAALGLPARLFNHHQLEWYGRVNLLKGGLAFADVAVAPSRSHAGELRTAVGGFGLHGIFARLGADLRGIDDGLDPARWNPAADAALTSPFTDLASRARNKAALQRAARLPARARTPLIVVPGPHTRRSGAALAVTSSVIRAGAAQVVFTGPAEGWAREEISSLAASNPGRVGALPDASERLLRRALAGADVVVLPALYEPSTAPALRAVRYGAVVVGRDTGGIGDALRNHPHAILFDDSSPAALDTALSAALAFAGDRKAAAARLAAALAIDTSWDSAVARYDDACRHALAVRGVA